MSVVFASCEACEEPEFSFVFALRCYIAREQRALNVLLPLYHQSWVKQEQDINSSRILYETRLLHLKNRIPKPGKIGCSRPQIPGQELHLRTPHSDH